MWMKRGNARDNVLDKNPYRTDGAPWHQDGSLRGRYFPNNTIALWIPLQSVAPEMDVCDTSPPETFDGSALPTILS